MNTHTLITDMRNPCLNSLSHSKSINRKLNLIPAYTKHCLR
uniref:Uncharacterized protein n=1 Tax=Anguilla anguilla TaxID=7936 RepID=A0A0E9S3C6_ANGAN